MQTKKTEALLVSGQGCMPESAYEEMTLTRQIWNKPGGRQYIHLVQSFDPKDPLTHTKAHEIGRQLAARFVGFQCVIATHKDRRHIHNHLVLCSVNVDTGLKFQQSRQQMQEVKDYSDKLCRTAGLSVIPPERKGKYRKMSEYRLEEKGAVTWRGILQGDIDDVLLTTFSFATFIEDMQRRGYEVKRGKHLSFKPRGGERFIRLRSLGEGYSEAAIRRKLEGSITATLHRAQTARRGATVRNNLTRQPPPKLQGFRVLYWHYLYLLGKVKTRQAPQYVSAHLKAELVKLERHAKQFRFLNHNGIETEAQLAAAEAARRQQVGTLTAQRKALYAAAKSAGGTGPDGGEVAAINSSLRALRADLRLTAAIREDSARLAENTSALDVMEQERAAAQRNHAPAKGGRRHRELER